MGARVKPEIDAKPSTGIHQNWYCQVDGMKRVEKKEIISQRVDGEEVTSFSARRKQWAEHL